MHPLVQLAKDAIESYIRSKDIIVPPSPLTKEMTPKAGVFVSLKKYGVLRGCIGTFSPVYDNVAEEVIHNAISAATRDPRFPALAPDELAYIDISVDVLTPPEPIKDESLLDPKRYGVIVVKGSKRGLLLPDIEGIDTVADQLAIAKRKAGIYPKDRCDLFRFKVERY